jgi:hypothetical protein
MYENLSFSSKHYFINLFAQHELTAHQRELSDNLLSKNALSWKQCAQLFIVIESLRGQQQ